MEYFAVTGGRPLAGEVRVHGAKNSALPILAATLLVRGESVVHNCPALTDIQTALDILSLSGLPGPADGGDGDGGRRAPDRRSHPR